MHGKKVCCMGFWIATSSYPGLRMLMVVIFGIQFWPRKEIPANALSRAACCIHSNAAADRRLSKRYLEPNDHALWLFNYYGAFWQMADLWRASDRRRLMEWWVMESHSWSCGRWRILKEISSRSWKHANEKFLGIWKENNNSNESSCGRVGALVESTSHVRIWRYWLPHLGRDRWLTYVMRWVPSFGKGADRRRGKGMLV